MPEDARNRFAEDVFGHVITKDGKVLLDNSGADLWVVQQNTLGPYAESSSLEDDLYRTILVTPGVAMAANVTYLTMQVGKGGHDVRSMVVGIVPGGANRPPGWPPFLVAGRHITRGHYEAVADVAARRTQAGDAVLLSPACSSYDMFGDFEERGRRFRALVTRRPA